MVSDAPQTRKLAERIKDGALENAGDESDKFERFKIGGIILAQEDLATKSFSEMHASLARSRTVQRDPNVLLDFVAAQEDALNAVRAPFKTWGDEMEESIKAHEAGGVALSPRERLYLRYRTLQERNIQPEDREEDFTPASQMLKDGFQTGVKAIWYAILCIPVLYAEKTGKVMTQAEFDTALTRSRQFIFARAFASAAHNDEVFAKAMLEPEGVRIIDSVATYGIDALSLDIDSLTLKDKGPRISSDMIDFLGFAGEKRESLKSDVVGCPAPHVAASNGVREYPNLIAGMLDEITDFARDKIGARLSEYTEEALKVT